MTQNNNSVAEVKIVTPATNKNDVAETASTENMKEINPQTEDPQVGPEAQPIGGGVVVPLREENTNGQVEAEHVDETSDLFVINALFKVGGYIDENEGLTVGKLKKYATFARNAKKALRPHIVMRFLVSELIEAGYIFVFDEQNRDLYRKQVDDLCEDLEKRPTKCFTEAGKIAMAEDLLNEGKTLTTADGTIISKDTPELWRYIVVLDGQHRIMVCLTHPECDMKVELAEYEGSTNEYYVTLNTARRNHTGSDQKAMIRSMHPGEVILLEETQALKNTYSVTDKYAEAMLSGSVDKFTKDDLAQVQTGKKKIDQKYLGEPEKIETGKYLMALLKAKYESDSVTYKALKKFQFPVALWKVYEGLASADKPEFKNKFALFLYMETNKVKDEIAPKVADKDFDNVLRSRYNDFCKHTHDEFAEMGKKLKEFMETISTSEEAKKAKNSKVKKLSSGSFSAVYSNIEAMQKANEEKRAKESVTAAAPSPNNVDDSCIEDAEYEEIK